MVESCGAGTNRSPYWLMSVLDLCALMECVRSGCCVVCSTAQQARPKDFVSAVLRDTGQAARAQPGGLPRGTSALSDHHHAWHFDPRPPPPRRRGRDESRVKCLLPCQNLPYRQRPKHPGAGALNDLSRCTARTRRRGGRAFPFAKARDAFERAPGARGARRGGRCARSTPPCDRLL